MMTSGYDLLVKMEQQAEDRNQLHLMVFVFLLQEL